MNKHGSLAVGLLLLLVLMVLAAGVLLRGVNENILANRFANSTQAFWAAEAGVQKTIWEINYNNCADFVQQGTSTACTSCTSCGAGNKTMAVSISGSCDYDVVVNNGITTATSTGACPNRSSSSVVKRNVQATIGPKSPFQYAAFSQGAITLSNNTFIDSYNSNNGAYGGGNTATNGSVGSNGTTDGVITLGNNISLGGSVSTGVGGTVTVGNNTTITGTTTHTNNVSLPVVVVPSALTGLGNGGVYSIAKNGSATLTAGDYKYTSVNMSSNSTLNITGGNVRLYLTGASAFPADNNTNTITVADGATLQLFIDGTLSFRNNFTLSSSGNVPKNIQIYSTYSGANGMKIDNNGVLAAAIYAPGTDISIGNNDDLLGSVVGKTIVVNNNAAIHYDESLGSLITSVGTTGITVWQEI